MKKKTTPSTLFYIAASLFYLAAIIGFVSGYNKAMDVVWLCLGSACLGLGTMYKKKEDQGSKKDE